MQPHTGAALCVFGFLIPDLERKYFPKPDQQPRKRFFPYTQFRVSSEVPAILHKASYKQYTINIESYHETEEMQLSIGQNWHCFLTIKILQFSPGEIKLDLNHSHTGPTERVILRRDVISGEYITTVSKEAKQTREALMISVPYDVKVVHQLDGEVRLERSYPNPEKGEDKRIVEIMSYDRPVKETNPGRKFAFLYHYKIEEANKLDVGV